MARNNKKKKSKLKALSFYKSIDELPIGRWFKADDKNDLGYLLKRYRSTKPHEKQLLGIVWDNMLSEFIDEFGIGEKMQKITDIRREIQILKIQEQEDKESRKTQIRILELDLLERTKDTVKRQSNASTMADVIKFMGVFIDENTTSVKLYFSFIRKMNDEYSRYAVNEFR